MKVLHITADMDPVKGGVQQGLRTVVSILSERGVYNEVTSLNSPDASFLAHDFFINNPLGPAKGPWSYSSKLIPWLLENLMRFDVVIVHGIWQFHGYAVRQAMNILREKNISKSLSGDMLLPKVFVFPQGMLDPYFQRAPGRKLKALRNSIYWKFIEGKLINEADGVFFTAEDEKRLAREPFHPYRPRREEVVGMCQASPPPYVPNMKKAFLEECSDVKDRPYLLFLSRIHEKKGVDLLIKAYLNVLQNIQTTKNKIMEEADISEVKESDLPLLVIAGPGLETQYGLRMQKLVSNSPELKNRVFFPGMLAGDAKWGAFYGCEAFILPTHQENFGIAITEALACGKPVLITHQTNIWQEIISAGGGIVGNDTLQGTQGLIEQWINLSNDEKMEYSHRALSTYLQHFEMDKIADKWISTINK
ncbi:glycosyltransferase [Pontibacter harenae]|uniref:glycosyltransferase n=1 Tax=Pontibacter harenae TaxID=2894083 RepID=UPI001E2DC7C2|nr:glycosyltransferase [Pontibacter harenae]MCC9167210.1 glycosyltransferase [Pontibacter harenae]